MTRPSTKRRTIALDGVEVVIFPERGDVHRDLVPLHDFWTGYCDGAVPLPRSFVDPVHLPPKVLPGFAIIEVFRDPIDFRYRLLGTNLIQFSGRNSTGKRFSEIAYPQPQDDRLKHYFELVVNEGVIVYRETTADWANRDYLTIASMFLPGTSDGRSTDFIFGAVAMIR